jgi:hypothetical protein
MVCGSFNSGSPAPYVNTSGDRTTAWLAMHEQHRLLVIVALDGHPLLEFTDREERRSSASLV